MQQSLPPTLSVQLRAYLHRWRGEPELGMLRWLCDRNRTSLDIGANRGQYAYFLRRYSGGVICFEPHPRLAGYLRESLGKAVSVRECALSDSTGRAALHVPVYDGELENDGLSSLHPRFEGQPHKSFDVEVRRLDDLGLEDVGFIKIDVEGEEANVLRGGLQLLERDRPLALVESEQRHAAAAPRSVFHLLAAVGYRGFFWSDKRWHPVSQFSLELHQNPRHAPGFCGESYGRYINNFLFLPVERRAPALPGLP